jgi:hypothetical protein
MARRQVVTYAYTCDVCGGRIAEGDADGASRKISWEGSDYVVDVCSVDQVAVDAVLSKLKVFVDAGSGKATTKRHRTSPGSASKTRATKAPREVGHESVSSPARPDLPAIRVWARENGHRVAARGRIPATLIAAYVQAKAPSTPGIAPAPGKRRARRAAAAKAAP